MKWPAINNRWHAKSGNLAHSPFTAVISHFRFIEWELVMRGDGDGDSRVLLPQEIVSPEGVSLYSQYQVSLYNELGLGKGLQAQKVTPFYKTWWFRVIVALAALTIIIAVVALLSCYCYRQKGEAGLDTKNGSLRNYHFVFTSVSLCAVGLGFCIRISFYNNPPCPKF